jgi:hypothetical protein
MKESLPYYIDMVFVDSTIGYQNSQIYINEEPLYPFLTDGGTVSKRVIYDITDSPTLHIRIQNLVDSSAFTDIRYRPGIGNKISHYLTLYQARLQDTMGLVLPSALEPFPALGYAKVQCTYTDGSLPDSMKLRFYQSSSTTAVDSLIVRRYEFSSWASMKVDKSDNVVQYEMLNAATGAMIKAKGTFVTRQYLSIDDFNIYSIFKDASGVITLARLY